MAIQAAAASLETVAGDMASGQEEEAGEAIRSEDSTVSPPGAGADRSEEGARVAAAENQE